MSGIVTTQPNQNNAKMGFPLGQNITQSIGQLMPEADKHIMNKSESDTPQKKTNNQLD